MVCWITIRLASECPVPQQTTLWLSSHVRDAFVHKQSCMSVFFYLDKAYDTAWRHGILLDLHSLGICGNMLNFVRSYLTDRTFWVQVGSISQYFTQENGVPQGGVISCTLFIVKMNSLKKRLTTLPIFCLCQRYPDKLQIL